MHIAKKRLENLIDVANDMADIVETYAFDEAKGDYAAELKRDVLYYREAIRLAQEALDASPPWEN